MVSVFIDFSKAFDKISHRYILRILYRNGIDVKIIKWYSDYFGARRKDRYLVVKINDVKSEKKRITSGNIQGSKSGPEIFCLAMEPLLDSIGNLNKPVMERLGLPNHLFNRNQHSAANWVFATAYADDIKIYMMISNHKDKEKLQCALGKVEEWCRESSMEVNEKKTALMKIQIKKDRLYDEYISLEENMNVAEKMAETRNHKKRAWMPEERDLDDFKREKENDIAQARDAREILNIKSEIRRRILPPELDFYINETPIKEVEHFNDLGVIISNDLTWNKHWRRFKSKVMHLKMLLNLNLGRDPGNRILENTYKKIIVPKLIFGSVNSLCLPSLYVKNLDNNMTHGILAWELRDKLFKRWFSIDHLCSVTHDGYYTNLDMNANCLVDWIREVLRFKFGEAQLTKDDLWSVRNGDLTNKLKHYPLGSFNHTAHKIWNTLPAHIKTMDGKDHLTSKQNCKRVMDAIKKEGFFTNSLFNNVEKSATVREKRKKLNIHNERVIQAGKELKVKSLQEFWPRSGQHSQNRY